MLEFLRKTKEGIAPTLDEVESLIEQIDKLKGNLIDLKVAIANGSSKAQKQIPALLLTIQGNLERDLKLVNIVQEKVAQQALTSDYQFEKEIKIGIFGFCYKILVNFDGFFFRRIDKDSLKDSINSQVTLEYISFEINRYFEIDAKDITALKQFLDSNGLTINDYNVQSIIEIYFKLVLEIIIDPFFKKRKGELLMVLELNQGLFFSLSQKNYYTLTKINDICPFDWFVEEFEQRLKRCLLKKI